MSKIKTHSKRAIALMMVCVLLLGWIALPQRAEALTGIDDLAIIAALLASLGISAVTYGATQTMLDGLAERLDEYGETQGMEPGQFADSIIAQTSVRGPRILQLARAGWQALTGFINYLKTEQGGGLSSTTPIVNQGNSTVIINGVAYNAIITDNAFGGNASMTGVTIADGFYARLTYSPAQTVTVPYPDDNTQFTTRIKSGIQGYTYTNKSAGNRGGDATRGANYFYLALVYSTANHRLALAWSDDIALEYKAFYYNNNEYGESQVQAGQRNWQINDDNFDLSYLTDAVSDIYIRLGSIAGDVDTLAGIGQAVLDAYDTSYAETGAGTITATATTADIGAAGDYALPELVDFFPFCIPFDVYHMIQALSAEPKAPVIEIPLDFSLGGQQQTLYEQDAGNKLVIDLTEWEQPARILRMMELILFAVGLALITWKVAKW